MCRPHTSQAVHLYSPKTEVRECQIQCLYADDPRAWLDIQKKKTEGKEVWKIKIFRREYFLKTKYEI